MQEYFGKSAKAYQQTPGKQFVLIPAIERAIPQAKNSNSKLLDLGCGNGDFYELVTQKGYKYSGLDISSDMIGRAKNDYPQGQYIVSSSTDFSDKFKEKFDIVLSNMLFLAFNNTADIVKTLKETKKVLNKNGLVIIGVSHPCYDNYMRRGLFGKEDVETNFKGYYASGTKYLTHKEFDNGKITFEDYHWTLSDYLKALQGANLQLIGIDECKPVEGDKDVMERKIDYPTYMVLICKGIF